MLPKDLDRIARARVEVELRQRDVEYTARIQRITAEMAAAGLGRSGIHEGRILDATQEELQQRAAFIWQTWCPLLREAQQLKADHAPGVMAQVQEYVGSEEGQISTMWRQSYMGATDRLSWARNHAITRAQAQIEFEFDIDAHDRSEERQRRLQFWIARVSILGGLAAGVLATSSGVLIEPRLSPVSPPACVDHSTRVDRVFSKQRPGVFQFDGLQPDTAYRFPVAATEAPVRSRVSLCGRAESCRPKLRRSGRRPAANHSLAIHHSVRVSRPGHQVLVRVDHPTPGADRQGRGQHEPD